MKAYCKSCEAIQPSSFRPYTDSVTGASYEDLCCDICHYIVATIEEREALAQPAQEPVAWLTRDSVDGCWYATAKKVGKDDKPLYTAPPQEKNNAA